MKWFNVGLSLVAFAVVLYLFWPLVHEFRQVAHLFRTADWFWLAAAPGIHFASYCLLAALNFLLLRPFEGRIGFWRIVAVLPAIAFIEVAVPSAGASGLVMRAHLLKRSGYSAEASTFTAGMETFYLGLMMAMVAFSGLGYVLRREPLSSVQTFFLVAVALLAVILGGLVLWIGQHRTRAMTWAWRLARGWNRLLLALSPRIHRQPLTQSAIAARVDRFYDGLSHLRQARQAPFLLTAAGRVLLDVATLGVCFAAFHYKISPGMLLSGYGLMLLLSGLAALPGGLGLADASLAVIYARLGAPGAVAVAAALAYRLIAFWLIRFVGFLTWQVIENETRRDNSPALQ